MSKRFYRFYYVILTSFLALTLSSLLITGSLQIVFSYQSQTRIISANQKIIAREASSKVDAYIKDKVYIIDAAIYFSGNVFRDSELITDFCESLLAKDPSFRNIAVFDTTNTLAGSSSRQSTNALRDFIHLVQSEPEEATSPVYIDKDTNEPLLIIYLPWINAIKEIKGRIAVELNLKYMWDLIETLNAGKSSETYVIDNTGRIIASKDSSRVIRNENLDHIPFVKDFTRGTLHTEITNTLYQGISGNTVIGEYTVLDQLHWAVITETPVLDAYNEIIYNALLSAAIIFIIAGIVVVISFRISNTLALPIKNLTNAALEIAAGDLYLNIPVINGSYETAKLTEAFNSMTDNLRKKISDLDAEIAHRQEAQKELSKAQNYIANIINSMPSQIIGVSSEGLITKWNMQTERITGISSEQAIGNRIDAVLPSFKNDLDRITRAINTRTEQGHYKKHEYINGMEHYEDITIYPLIANGVEGAVIRIDDITEKVKLEEVIIQSEKMMSVGGMAAGMAHEINNPLAGIIQISEVLLNRLVTNFDMKANQKAADELNISPKVIKQFMEMRNIPKMILNITDSANRVSKIVQNMLSFAKKDSDHGTYNDIREILDNCIELSSIDYNLKKDYDFKKIEIKTDYADDIPPLLCNRSKLQQVFMNILKNGAEAMYEKKDTTSQFTISCTFNTQQKFIKISIEDNGPGMDENTRKRIFEPFFTTKGTQKGTGLGLSVSYFIITEAHKGKMYVRSQTGVGSQFVIELPIEENKADGQTF